MHRPPSIPQAPSRKMVGLIVTLCGGSASEVIGKYWPNDPIGLINACSQSNEGKPELRELRKLVQKNSGGNLNIATSSESPALPVVGVTAASLTQTHNDLAAQELSLSLQQQELTSIKQEVELYEHKLREREHNIDLREAQLQGSDSQNITIQQLTVEYESQVNTLHDSLRQEQNTTAALKERVQSLQELTLSAPPVELPMEDRIHGNDQMVGQLSDELKAARRTISELVRGKQPQSMQQQSHLTKSESSTNTDVTQLRNSTSQCEVHMRAVGSQSDEIIQKPVGTQTDDSIEGSKTSIPRDCVIIKKTDLESLRDVVTGKTNHIDHLTKLLDASKKEVESLHLLQAELQHQLVTARHTCEAEFAIKLEKTNAEHNRNINDLNLLHAETIAANSDEASAKEELLLRMSNSFFEVLQFSQNSSRSDIELESLTAFGILRQSFYTDVTGGAFERQDGSHEVTRMLNLANNAASHAITSLVQMECSEYCSILGEFYGGVMSENFALQQDNNNHQIERNLLLEKLNECKDTIDVQNSEIRAQHKAASLLDEGLLLQQELNSGERHLFDIERSFYEQLEINIKTLIDPTFTTLFHSLMSVPSSHTTVEIPCSYGWYNSLNPKELEEIHTSLISDVASSAGIAPSQIKVIQASPVQCLDKASLTSIILQVSSGILPSESPDAITRRICNKKAGDNNKLPLMMWEKTAVDCGWESLTISRQASSQLMVPNPGSPTLTAESVSGVSEQCPVSPTSPTSNLLSNQPPTLLQTEWSIAADSARRWEATAKETQSRSQHVAIEIMSLREEMERAETQIHTSEQQASHWESKFRNLEGELEQKIADGISRITGELCNASEMLLKLKIMHKLAAEEVDSLSAKNDVLQKELVESQAAAHASDQLLADLHRDLEIQKVARADGVRQLADDCRRVASELHTAQAETRRFAALLEQSKQELLTQSNELNTFKASLEEAQAQITATEASKNSLILKVSSKEQELEKVKQLIGSYQGKIQTMTIDTCSLRETLTSTVDNAKQKEEVTTSLIHEKARLHNEIENQQKQIEQSKKDKQSATSELQSYIESLTKQLQQASVEARDAAAVYKTLTEERNESKNKIEELTTTTNDLINKLSGAEKDASKMRQSIVEYEQHSSETEEQFRQEKELLESKIISLTSEKELLDDEIKKLTAAGTQETEPELSDENIEVEDETNITSEEMQQLQKELAAAERTSNIRRTENQELQLELLAKSNEIRQMGERATIIQSDLLNLHEVVARESQKAIQFEEAHAVQKSSNQTLQSQVELFQSELQFEKSARQKQDSELQDERARAELISEVAVREAATTLNTEVRRREEAEQSLMHANHQTALITTKFLTALVQHETVSARRSLYLRHE